jgi:hypothetical protein
LILSTTLQLEPKLILSTPHNLDPENIYDRTEQELTKVYERVIRKYQQVDQGIKSINRHIKLIIATIPPTDLIQTLLKYPHKSEKIVFEQILFQSGQNHFNPIFL